MSEPHLPPPGGGRLTPGDVRVGGDEACPLPGEPPHASEDRATADWSLHGHPRRGLSLCLSGGGYRAAMVHLGALRRLDELGVLAEVDVISGVSGGSLAAGMLADPQLDWSGSRVAGFEQRFAVPLDTLAGKNIRTRALLTRLLPWRWFQRGAGVLALQHRLEREAAALALPLVSVGTSPRIVVSATDLTFGVGWVFSGPREGTSARMGSSRAGYTVPPPEWTLAAAVATSSAIPPFFSPRQVGELAHQLVGGRRGPETPQQRAQLLDDLQLTDGGVYDNLGLEPVWKTAATILVSDGGAVFRARTALTWLGRLFRVAEVIGRGGIDVRLRWLHSMMSRGVLRGSTWDLADAPGQSDSDRGYPEQVVQAIAQVRTDYDAFSPELRRVLENHGYALAEAAVRRHAPELVTLEAPFVVPHPELADPRAAARALVGSDRRTLLGRF